jgi:orotate phosphoribosyltransferase
MTENETALLALLRERSFRCGSFRLASGQQSDHYIDGKMTTVSPAGAYLIGEVICERTKSLGVDAIGGIEVGAVPLVTATIISYYHRGLQIEGFWVRDQAKNHGTQKTIEGDLRPGSRVVIVDDVFTQGKSALKAVEAVRKIDCEVVVVLALVDRLAGAKDRFREAGIKNYQSVFTIRDFGVGVDVGRSAEVACR